MGRCNSQTLHPIIVVRNDLACRSRTGLGTATAALGQPKVVLPLIGGGVFGNPIPLIWEAIVWAAREVEPLVGGMDVVVNGRNLGEHDRLDKILPAVRIRGGAAVVFGPDGVSVRR